MRAPGKRVPARRPHEERSTEPAGWWDDGGPRRLIERTPLGVPIGAAAAAAGLGLGAHLGLVSDALAWGLGGPLFLGVEAYTLYALIAWRRARRAGSDGADGPRDSR